MKFETTVLLFGQNWNRTIALTRADDLAPTYRDVPVVSTWPMWGLLIVAGLTICIGIGLVRWFRSDSPESPMGDGLLNELCREHQLSLSIRTVLVRVATSARCAHPAELFFSLEEFDRIVAAANRNARLRQNQKSRIGEARRTLFPESGTARIR